MAGLLPMYFCRSRDGRCATQQSASRATVGKKSFEVSRGESWMAEARERHTRRWVVIRVWSKDARQNASVRFCEEPAAPDFPSCCCAGAVRMDEITKKWFDVSMVRVTRARELHGWYSDEEVIRLSGAPKEVISTLYRTLMDRLSCGSPIRICCVSRWFDVSVRRSMADTSSRLKMRPLSCGRNFDAKASAREAWRSNCTRRSGFHTSRRWLSTR